MNNADILMGANLSKKYGSLEVVKDVSLTVREGEFVSLVGKSGCGKTTLLSLLSGLEKPTKDRLSSTVKRLPALRKKNWLYSVGHMSVLSFNLSI